MTATQYNYRIGEVSRFLMLLGGLGASVCISTFYGFNILSNNMVVLFNFTSADITTITTVGVVVGYATFPGGMLLDYAGPVPVLVLSTLLNFVGVLLYGLAFEGVIHGSVVKFSVFSAIMTLGCASFDTGSLMAVLGNFPLTRGPVVAIMKTFAGLGASILAVINYSFFRTAYSHYMYFMAALVVFMGTLASLFIRFPPYHLVDREKARLPEEVQVRRRLTERAYLTQRPPMTRFYVGFAIIVSLVIYLTVPSFCVAYAAPSDAARRGSTLVIICFVFALAIMALPLRVLGGMGPAPSTEYPEYPQTTSPSSGNVEAEQAVVKPPAAEVALDGNALEDGCLSDTAAQPKSSTADAVVLEDDDLALMALSDQDPQYQTTFLQSLRQPDIWLCWWNTLATWGCGIVMSFDSAQIHRALANDEYETKTNAIYLAIISVGSALGRLSMGAFELVLSRQPSGTRPVITDTAGNAVALYLQDLQRVHQRLFSDGVYKRSPNRRY